MRNIFFKMRVLEMGNLFLYKIIFQDVKEFWKWKSELLKNIFQKLSVFTKAALHMWMAAFSFQEFFRSEKYFSKVVNLIFTFKNFRNFIKLK